MFAWAAAVTYLTIGSLRFKTIPRWSVECRQVVDESWLDVFLGTMVAEGLLWDVPCLCVEERGMDGAVRD